MISAASMDVNPVSVFLLFKSSTPVTFSKDRAYKHPPLVSKAAPDWRFSVQTAPLKHATDNMSPPCPDGSRVKEFHAFLKSF